MPIPSRHELGPLPRRYTQLSTTSALIRGSPCCGGWDCHNDLPKDEAKDPPQQFQEMVKSDWQITGNSEAEIMPKIEQHGREKHTMKIDDDTRKKVHSAIHRKAA